MPAEDPDALFADSGPLFVVLGVDGEFADAVARQASEPLGFEPDVSALPTPSPRRPEAAEALVQYGRDLAGELYLVPMSPEFGLFEREVLRAALERLGRQTPAIAAHYDEFDIGHPSLVQAFAEVAQQALEGVEIPRERLGLLLVASGEGDPGSRAQAYRLMRLLWEQLGLARGEVAFLRHAAPSVGAELERNATDGLTWLVVPLLLDAGEPFRHLKLIVGDHRRRLQPAPRKLLLADPPGAHSALVGWAAQRLAALWLARSQAEPDE